MASTAVPFSVQEEDEAVREKLAAAIRELNSTYRAVITIDRN
jgi:hypothetical protein